jgi:anti-sigma regulatory factor (Ser/Thr protein kinase)
MFYSQSFPKTAAASAQTREMLARMNGELPDSMLDDARLLASELVANAVEHASADGEVEVRMDLSDERLRVEVYDNGAGFDWVPRRHDAGNARGWGLHFTDQVASRWSIERGERNCVWFELDRS